MKQHETSVERNPHGSKFWWVCTCGDKAKKRVNYPGYAEADGKQHERDKGAQ